MEPNPKFINVAVYGTEKALFLVSLKTKNVPGVLGEIATKLGNAGVNILSCSNFSLPDNPESVISFFAESKDLEMTEERLSKLFSQSSSVLEMHVKRSDSELLVDDFSFPLMYYPGGRGVIFPQSGISAMFTDLVELFGSGGESILFRAGYSVGRQGSEDLAKLFGEGKMMADPNSFTKLYSALGWGKLEVIEVSSDLTQFKLKLVESFECSGVKAKRPHGHFSRGLIAGASERLMGAAVHCEEEKCAAVGDDFCLFTITSSRSNER